MFFSKGSKNKKSARQVRVRYRPELLALEDRVVPSTMGLDALLQPPGHAAAAASAAAPSTDQGIGSQVSAQAQTLQDARTPGGTQGIGTDLSTFVHTLVGNTGDEGHSGQQSPAGGADTDPSSVFPTRGQGIGSQVSAKAHELQDARTDGGSQGIGHDLSAFVHTLVGTTGNKGDSDQQSPASGADTDPSSGGIGDQVSAKAHELQDARTPGDSQGIGAELSAFVHTLVGNTGDEGDSGHSSAPALQATAHGAPTLPAAAGDGIATAAGHNASSEAAEHSPIFESSSPASAAVTLPGAAGNGIGTAAAAIASSEAADHSPIFQNDSSADALLALPAAGDGIAKAFSEAETDSSADAAVTLPAAAEDGIARAAGENASSQAPDHAPVFDTDLVSADDSPAASE